MRYALLKLLALDNSAPVNYTLDVSPEEAKQILDAAVEAEGTHFFMPAFPLRWKSERQFQLYRQRNRNSWRRILTATLEDNGHGTRLTGQSELSMLVIGFTLAWIVAAMGPVVLMLTTDWPITLPAILFPIFGFALPHIGRAMSRKDEQDVLELLDKAFAGHITEKQIPE